MSSPPSLSMLSPRRNRSRNIRTLVSLWFPVNAPDGRRSERVPGGAARGENDAYGRLKFGEEGTRFLSASLELGVVSSNAGATGDAVVGRKLGVVLLQDVQP